MSDFSKAFHNEPHPPCLNPIFGSAYVFAAQGTLLSLLSFWGGRLPATSLSMLSLDTPLSALHSEYSLFPSLEEELKFYSFQIIFPTTHSLSLKAWDTCLFDLCYVIYINL